MTKVSPDKKDSLPLSAMFLNSFEMQILDFLLQNHRDTFLITNIVERLDCSPNTVRNCLTRLEKQGKVQVKHMGRAEGYRLDRSYYTFLVQTKKTFNQCCPELAEGMTDSGECDLGMHK